MPGADAQPATRRFCPPAWAWLLTLALLAVMLRLGFWQLDRAEEKRGIKADYERALLHAPEMLATPAPPADAAPKPVRVTGRYLPEAQLLLDSQVREGQGGVRVWTPMKRDDGGIILVDRGWIPDPGRERAPALPVEAGARSVTGLWRPLPQGGLAVANPLCDVTGTVRVQYPDISALRCRYGQTLADGLLLLDPEAADGFTREWAPDYLRPEVHLGYAVQWFGFAAALLVIFIVVNWKKRQ